MSQFSRRVLQTAVAIVVCASVCWFCNPSSTLSAPPAGGSNSLAEQVAALSAAVAALQATVAEQRTQLDAAATRISALEAKLAHVYVETGTINGLAGPHLIIEGCNVHVRSGSGDTYDYGFPSGLGNLVVGYNATSVASRTGSHNLVVGDFHEYSSSGGFVAGRGNSITARGASVSGGVANEASGDNSSVSGGIGNKASGDYSAVSGGVDNVASGDVSTVSGGAANAASGESSAVSGGGSNTASGDYSAVSGGYLNEANGDYSTVSGGVIHYASDPYSLVP